MNDKEVIDTLVSDYSKQAKLSKKERQIYEHGILTGFEVAKQAMIKDAIDAEVSIRILPDGKGFISYNTNQVSTTCKEGYKVKLKVLEEE